MNEQFGVVDLLKAVLIVRKDRQYEAALYVACIITLNIKHMRSVRSAFCSPSLMQCHHVAYKLRSLVKVGSDSLSTAVIFSSILMNYDFSSMDYDFYLTFQTSTFFLYFFNMAFFVILHYDFRLFFGILYGDFFIYFPAYDSFL